jgi:hypothetical protein
VTHHVCAADLGLRSDGTGAVVLRVDHVLGASGPDGKRPRRTHLTLASYYERRPTREAPLSPSVVCGDIARIARARGCREVWADQFYVEAFREELRKHGLVLREAPAGVTGKAEVWSTCRARILEGHVSVPNVPALLSQLKAVRSRPTSGGGLSIEQPRAKGTHADLASAFALAVWAATASRAATVELPDDWEERDDDLPRLRFADDFSFGGRF